jgi:hypothetical protein
MLDQSARDHRMTTASYVPPGSIGARVLVREAIRSTDRGELSRGRLNARLAAQHSSRSELDRPPQVTLHFGHDLPAQSRR